MGQSSSNETRQHLWRILLRPTQLRRSDFVGFAIALPTVVLCVVALVLWGSEVLHVLWGPRPIGIGAEGPFAEYCYFGSPTKYLVQNSLSVIIATICLVVTITGSMSVRTSLLRLLLSVIALADLGIVTTLMVIVYAIVGEVNLPIA